MIAVTCRARTIGSIASLLTLLAFAHQTQTASAQGEALFARAVTTAENDARAPFATYNVVVSFTNGGRHIVDTWQTTEDLRHAVVRASSFSEQERAAPTTPHGINIVGRRLPPRPAAKSLDPEIDPATSVNLKTNPLNPERTGDPVGPVALAVDQDYGLTPPRAYRIAHDDSTMASSADELVTIGRTGARAERYRIALLDSDGAIAHLELAPLRDPYRNRLRELWIDTETAYVREAIVQGVGDRAPFDRVRWHVTYVRREGASYVSEVHALEPITLAGTLDDVRITFSDLALLSFSPLKFTFGISAAIPTLRDP